MTATVPGPTVTVTASAASAAPVAPSTPQAAPTPTEAPKAPPAAPTAGTLPNFAGQQLQAAQDGAQAAGFYLLDSTDATGAGGPAKPFQ
ncbi:hypothetical protein ACFVYT_32580 [Streptomyces sp. NPDC058290]|uniref:hypothetical protein n=1 Tax=Streptomyces sp. NPDC058290 TaxID=3346426 RepID=UPI0036E87AC0